MPGLRHATGEVAVLRQSRINPGVTGIAGRVIANTVSPIRMTIIGGIGRGVGVAIGTGNHRHVKRTGSSEMITMTDVGTSTADAVGTTGTMITNGATKIRTGRSDHPVAV